MKSIAVLALSLLPLALAAPANDLSKRTPGNAYMCTEENWGGQCENHFFDLGGCNEVPGEYLFNIGSFGPDQGAICTFFDENHNTCGGTGLDILQFSGQDNLYSIDGNPGGNVKYVSCKECTACT